MNQTVFEIQRMFMDMCMVPQRGMKVSLDNETEPRTKSVYVFSYIPEKNKCEWVREGDDTNDTSNSSNSNSDSAQSEEINSAEEKEQSNQHELTSDAPKIQKKKNARRNILLIELLHVQDALQKNNIPKASELLDQFIKQHAHKIVEIKNKEKKTRVKTSYNTFISNTLLKLKNECPHISPPLRMRMAVSQWHELCQSSYTVSPSLIDTT